MYKLVMFDLDGTILNTVPDIKRVLNQSLAHFNLPQIDDEKTKKFVGDGAYMLVKRACGDIPEDKIREVYAHYFKNFASCDNGLSTYYKGEQKALEKLCGEGIKLGVITNKPQAATLNVYKKFFAEYNFFFVQGQVDGVPLKPAPDALLRAIALSGCKRQECLFVGDGEADIQVARNAKVDSVSVLWGYRSKSQLKAAGATAFVKNFAQLKKLVLKSD